MRFRSQHEDQIDVSLDLGELKLLRTVLHEVCRTMHFTDNDFMTILDTPRSEAEALLLRISKILERLHLPSD